MIEHLNARIVVAAVGMAIGLVPGTLREARAVVVNNPSYENAGSVGTVTGPNTAWFGRWGTNASAIAVGPNLVLTTRHQGTASTVNFGGTDYNVTSIANLGGAGVDLQLATIDGFFGGNFATLYSGTLSTGATLAFGGFGGQRGTSPGVVNGSTQLVGYTTNSPSNASGGPFNNNPLLLAQNRIESTGGLSTLSGFENTVVFRADFDGPDNVPNGATGISPAPTSKVFMEGSPTAGDSGGGWFINDGGTWRLVGLTETAPISSNYSQVYFQPMDTVDLRSYATLVPEPTAAVMASGIGLAALRRRRITPR